MPRPERVVTVRQALPRRVHLLLPSLAWQRPACERVARALAAAAPSTRARVRVATGSVIVERREGVIDAGALARAVEELVRAERDEEGRPLTSLRLEHHPSPTRIARALVRAVSGINADVRDALDDRADLGTILPVFFAAAGIAEVGTSGKLPVPTWFNLLWWSLRAFMTFNIRAVEEEVEDGEDAGALVSRI